jgi:RNA recognition motif-containing protein
MVIETRLFGNSFGIRSVSSFTINMKLYVGNLSFETNETSLQDAFAEFGTVTDTVIMIDRTTNRSRGFGFVTMGNAAEGTAAINGLNGVALDGRNLTVNEARPREERGSDRGGDRGGRSYGSRR